MKRIKILDSNDKEIESFYQVSYEHWAQLKENNLMAIKNCCLQVVAKVITQNKKSSQSLLDIFATLTDKMNHFVSDDSFCALVLSYNEELAIWEKNVADQVKTFYRFAKYFVIVDFPLVFINQNFIKLIGVIIQNKFG